MAITSKKCFLDFHELKMQKLYFTQFHPLKNFGYTVTVYGNNCNFSLSYSNSITDQLSFIALIPNDNSITS